MCSLMTNKNIGGQRFGDHIDDSHLIVEFRVRATVVEVLWLNLQAHKIRSDDVLKPSIWMQSCQ